MPKNKKPENNLPSLESRTALPKALEKIYFFFKPMQETCVWANWQSAFQSVCVSWQFADGYTRWYEAADGTVRMEWVESK